jgi:hypothetical protein
MKQDNRRRIDKTFGSFKVMFRVLDQPTFVRIIIAPKPSSSIFWDTGGLSEFDRNLMCNVFEDISQEHNETLIARMIETNLCWFMLPRTPETYEFFHNIERYFVLAKLKV